ncbi:MAG: anthrone oxygenase family protein [Burkholderiaceae bacterium]
MAVRCSMETLANAMYGQPGLLSLVLDRDESHGWTLSEERDPLMLTVSSFQIVLLVAAFLCALVAGFLFAFVAVVMPGIQRLGNRDFIRAFQVIDGVIQGNQPLFMLVWVGSVLFLGIAAILGLVQLDGADRLLIVFAALAYLLGVQLPTIRVNIPLNNALQALNVESMSEAEQQAARIKFERRWNRWNAIRTAIASLVSLTLMALLLRA